MAALNAISIPQETRTRLPISQRPLFQNCCYSWLRTQARVFNSFNVNEERDQTTRSRSASTCNCPCPVGLGVQALIGCYAYCADYKANRYSSDQSSNSPAVGVANLTCELRMSLRCFHAAWSRTNWISEYGEHFERHKLIFNYKNYPCFHNSCTDPVYKTWIALELEWQEHHCDHTRDLQSPTLLPVDTCICLAPMPHTLSRANLASLQLFIGLDYFTKKS